MINNLDSEEIQQLLQSARVGRLGCIVNGDPYVVPINYEFREGYLWPFAAGIENFCATREPASMRPGGQD